MDGRDEPVIQVDGLSKHYGDLKAVDGVSFCVERGEVFGILGPNGAGKTTTLECIEGLTEPTGGSTAVLGFDTQRDAREVKERIGVQLQASAFFDFLSLTEILDLFGRFYKRRIAPLELLAHVNLADRAKERVANLSGGQRQRFAIAIALVNDPDVVFLDEPTTGLDPQARRNLWEFIRSLHDDGRTIVLTTHYMEEAEYLCDRVAIMDGGKIIALDTPAKLISTLPVPYEIRAAMSHEYNMELTNLVDLPGISSASLHADGTYRLGCEDASIGIGALTAWAADAGIQITHLEVVAANLEDVFLSMTGNELRD